MSRFMLDLVVYYACAISAETTTLPTADVLRCSRAYEQAKTHFYPGEPAPRNTRARAQQSNAAFSAFRAWEAENPDKVAAFKAMARDWEGSGPSA